MIALVFVAAFFAGSAFGSFINWTVDLYTDWRTAWKIKSRLERMTRDVG
jgi:hypothetical protein